MSRKLVLQVNTSLLLSKPHAALVSCHFLPIPDFSTCLLVKIQFTLLCDEGLLLFLDKKDGKL